MGFLSLLNRSVIGFALALPVGVHSFASDVEDARSKFLREIRDVEKAYSNVAMKGRFTRHRDIADYKPEIRTFEYRRLGDKRRLIIHPETADGETSVPAADAVDAAVFVSSPDTSFCAIRYKDGREELQFVSPRRGVGKDAIFEDMIEYVCLCAACCSYADQFITEKIADGNMELGSEVTVDRSEQRERIVLDLKRMGFSKKWVRDPDTARPFTGKLFVVPEEHWRVAKWQLHLPPKNSSPPVDIELVVSCNNSKPGEIPVIRNVEWKSRWVNRSLEVEELQFGVTKPYDFTLRGCKIATLDLSHSHGSFSLIFWWAGAVFVVCVVILLFLRFHRRRRKPQGEAG